MKDSQIVRRRIICVDDVQVMLLSLKDRLKKHYEIYPAQSAVKLFETLEEVKPDLILSDINMPKVDGFEILRRLKADERFSEIPVIFLTGKASKNDIAKALDLGAADVLFKPVTNSDLIARIDYQFSPAKQKENKPIILAVDDSPSILKSVNHTLKDRYKVYTLPKPEAITEILHRLTPDLFLLDCYMPKLTGIDLIGIIRDIPVHKETPIVFLTSENNYEIVSATIERGVCDYIIKPIDETILREKLAVHLKDFMKRRLTRLLN